MRVILALCCLLVACESKPLTQGQTAVGLRRILAAPPACEPQFVSGGWYVDQAKCAREGPKQREAARAALAKLHADEIAAAPSCVREYHPTSEQMQNYGVDPTSEQSAAELLTRGVFVSTLAMNPECATAICAWQTRYDPRRRNPYCGGS